MITAIDQSRHWRGGAPGRMSGARLLETLFHHRPARRPASRTEVVLLSRALECPEAAIERHRTRRNPRLLLMQAPAPKPYTPNIPA